ncbi:MAG TPA: 2,5-didehydrogluconate reductase [Cyanobacteria bacterium UBA8156]|nr:2,5-didehydrogluconate reductase [Cyanobacteria bacterium UBA8156]
METVTVGLMPEVLPLGIGTWAWGDTLYWQYGQGYDKASVREAFRAAVAAGITLLDTAEVYGLGESERLIGEFCRDEPKPLAIATKFMPLPWRWGAAAVTQALQASLDRLQMKSVALYQVHQPVSFLLSQRTLLHTLAAAVRAGQIGAIGVSNYSAAQMREAHHLLAEVGVPLAFNQMPYSLLARQIERNGVLATAQELGVKILAYSPLAQGLLTGKYKATAPPKGGRQLNPQFGADGLFRIEPLLRVLQEIGAQFERTPSQVALNWAIAKGTTPIPGAKNAAQAIENAGALGWMLSSDEVAALDRASQHLS